MAEINSKFLSPRELKALIELGDIMIPRNGLFPSFSDTRCVQYVDDMLSYMDSKDRADLAFFLRIVSFFPKFGKLLIVNLLTTNKTSLLRLANLGLRAIVFGLYYSNKTHPDFKGAKPYDIIGYHVQVKSKPN